MKRRNKIKKQGTSWDEVSDWYDQLVGDEGSDYHKNLINPSALKMLAPKKGEKILDLACGQGVFCRELAKQGADVIGIDSSKKLIDFARSRSPENIKYIVSSVINMKSFQNESFDAATCIMAIQNIDPLDKAVEEIARILKKEGRLLIVMSHPCFRIPKQSNWGFDNRKHIQYRRIDRYMSDIKAPIKMHPGYDPSQITYTFHRPLSKYFQVLRSSGLAVLGLEEWISHRTSKPGSRQKSENQARAEIPLFLAILAKKMV
jgi:ubiquinone/menaquinone biosynthesis C-methylase UbiE